MMMPSLPLLGRDERSFEAAGGGCPNLDDVERSRDRRDRNRSLGKPELECVDGRCEALGIAADVLDRHAIEMKRLTARHALLLLFFPAA